MHAVVVYESMFGNTHAIAEAIGEGLRETSGLQVDVVPVAGARPGLLADAELVVVGGPTHVHGMAGPRTRSGAVQMAHKPGSGLALEPGAAGPGLAERLGTFGPLRARGAAFDTRASGPPALTGRASKAIGRRLRHSGVEMIAAPESFLVTKDNHLVEGEATRARQWGAELAAHAGAPLG